MSCCNSNNNNNSNIHYVNMQFSNSENLIVEDLETIPFNTIIANNGFTYSNGTFTTNCSGNYIIVYHINIEGSISTTTIKTTLLKNGIAFHTSLGNAVQSQYSGSTIVNLKSGDTIQLINDTGEEIELSFANISIYGV